MVIEKIFEHARDKPGKTAIYDSGRQIGYGTFASWISDAREFLSAQGLRPGCVAVLNIDSLIDAWVFGFALRSLGMTTVAVPALDRLDALGVRDIGCVITTIRDRPTQIAPTGTDYKLIRIPLHTYLGKSARSLRDIPKTTTPSGGHILFTSGTTGASKKVLIDDRGHATSIPRRMKLYGITERSVVNVFYFPIWTSLAYNISSCVWSAGGSVVIHQEPAVHKSLLVEGLTHAFFTPSTLSDLLTAPANEFRRQETVSLFVTGGPLPRALAELANKHLTPNLYSFIGSTEVGTWTVTRIGHMEDLQSHCIHPTAEVQIVDEADAPLPTGQLGAIRIRMTDGVTGYLDDEETSRAFFRHGYFYSGDIGVLRADGQLGLHGRVTNVLNVLGEKIAAEPIELTLQNRLSADGVCVFSLQSDSPDEELHIAIQMRRPVDKAELAAAIHAALPRFPHARVHFVDTIPRNDMGKIDRAALQQQIFGRQLSPH